MSAEAEDSTKEEEEEDEDLQVHWNLDTIPKELFLHICSFLSAKFVVNVLSQVCQRFRVIIEDESTWRIRLLSQWPKPYPLIEHSNFDWMEACCESEEQEKLWSSNAANMTKLHIRAAHSAAVDVVQIVENGHFLVSGARDRAVRLWNLDDLEEHCIVNGADVSQFTCCAEAFAAHTGWIWSTAYSDLHHTLYTGSWDSTIKCWSVNGFSSCEETTTYTSRSPVLCLAFSGEILTSGSYDRQVCFFDPRAGLSPVFQQNLHRKAVLCIAADEKFVISGSEDNTLVVYNRVAGKVQKTLEFEETYPLSMSYTHKNLWIGDNKGFIHLVDPTEEKFQLVSIYPSEHTGRINGIQYTLGSLITCASDKKLQVLAPCGRLKPITVLTSKSEFARISVHKQILASANCDDSISIWMPNHSEE